MEKQKSCLVEWQVVDFGSCYVLTGQVVNDPRFDDGEYVRTSKLIRVDFEKKEAETLNTIYTLA